MSLEIKRLTHIDAENYWKLRLEALQQAPEAFITTYDEVAQKENAIEETRDRLLNPNNYTYGANIDNKLSGVVTMLRETHTKFAHKAHILAMYVAPEARCQHVGSKLLRKAIEDAEATGIEQLQLSVVSSNNTAKSLYKRLGFSCYGMEKDAIKVENRYFDEDLLVFFLNEHKARKAESL